MTAASSRLVRTRALLVMLLACAALALPVQAQKPAPAQKLDEAYTKLIKEYTQDPRISTELVDHMPASDKVPSPLKFFGRIPGTPGELTYAKDIQRYYEALAKSSPRFKYWTIGRARKAATWCSSPSETRPPSSRSTNTRAISRTDRPAQDHRGAGPADHQDVEADLLGDRRHALRRDRRPRDAHRAAVPPGRRGDAFIQHIRKQRHRLHHPGARGGRQGEARRHVLLRQEDRASRGRRSSTGASTSRTTTTATPWGRC